MDDKKRTAKGKDKENLKLLKNDSRKENMKPNNENTDRKTRSGKENIGEKNLKVEMPSNDSRKLRE